MVCQQVIPVRRWDMVELRVSLQGMMISHADPPTNTATKLTLEVHCWTGTMMVLVQVGQGMAECEVCPAPAAIMT